MRLAVRTGAIASLGVATTSPRTPVCRRMVRTTAPSSAAAATPPARSRICATTSGSMTLKRRVQGRHCVTEDRFTDLVYNKKRRRRGWVSICGDFSGSGSPRAPVNAEYSSPRRGRAVRHMLGGQSHAHPQERNDGLIGTWVCMASVPLPVLTNGTVAR
jgi:hypothetical protein